MVQLMKKSLYVIWLCYIMFSACMNPNDRAQARRLYLRSCEALLRRIFNAEESLENFIIGLQILKESRFQGDNALPALIRDYYYDLFESAQSQDENDELNGYEENYILSGFISPEEFCMHGTQNVDLNCINALTQFGFEISVLGSEAFKIFYLSHNIYEINVETVYPEWYNEIPQDQEFNNELVVNIFISFMEKVQYIRSYFSYFVHEFRANENEIKDCEMIIKERFSANESTNNFEMGLIQYKKQDLENEHKFVYGYYMDMYMISQLININGQYFLSTLWSPKDYCKIEEEDYYDICLGAMIDFGFKENTLGIEAFKTFFFNYQTNQITVKSVYPNWKTEIAYDKQNDSNYVSSIEASYIQKVYMIQGYMYYFNRSFKERGNVNFKSPREYCLVVVE